MTTLNLQGLTFHVHSPSLLELMSVRRDVDDGARVLIQYDGFRWGICYAIPDRPSMLRFFKSRDAAIALIASRALSC